MLIHVRRRGRHPGCGFHQKSESWNLVEPPSAEKAKAQGIKGEFFIVEPDRTQLEEIGRLIDTGRLRAFVDSVLPIEQARQAFKQGLKGHSRGKIVLRIAG
jgi:NADPH:quinone reductase-like Zn-dependent oxidoreductase